jgi:hypothetical protein
MKSVAVSGSIPTSGSQDLGVDKPDISRPEYVSLFFDCIIVDLF